MVKPLHFKGDKKVKKRKRTDDEPSESGNPTTSTSSSAVTVSKANVSEELDAEDGWVHSDSVDDIKGPVIMLFGSNPPTCVACDANGKVFASTIQDIDGDDLATVEPHDVRQVWVATRIADTSKFSFKGHHGRYLACDKFGIFSATKEAISPEEEFTPIKTETGWALQTCREKFLSAVEKSNSVEIRGDAETIGYGETWIVRGQKRFKTKTKKEGEKVKEKISRRDLEKLAGQELDDDQVRLLKKAKREGNLPSALLDIRQKKKHDKFAY